jgi:hypothetical protein
MTAPVRLDAARDVPEIPMPLPATECWRRAVDIRREWLARALDTAPADRITVEDRLTNIYARLGRARPRFRWVDSPRQALPLLRDAPTHDDLYRWIKGRPPPGRPPFASDLAAALSRLRSALDDGFDRPEFGKGWYERKKKTDPWPRLPPSDALRLGIPPKEVLHQAVREAQHASLGPGITQPVRQALSLSAVAWYGQQESWIAYYDMLRRLGLARYRPGDERLFDDWADLARSGGWWWPGDEVVVAVERPAEIRTRPVPDGWHEEIELVSVRYRDGWRVP